MANLKKLFNSLFLSLETGKNNTTQIGYNKIKGCHYGFKTEESSLNPHADKNQAKQACR